MDRNVWVRRFVRDSAAASGDDYAAAFKLLGCIVYAWVEGLEPLLSGRLVAQRTFFRWAETLKRAGWGDVLADVGLRQATLEMLRERLGRDMRTEIGLGDAEKRGARYLVKQALSPQAVGRQASDAVKGLAVGREAEPSALDGVAAGGSLREATALAGSGRGVDSDLE